MESTTTDPYAFSTWLRDIGALIFILYLLRAEYRRHQSGEVLVDFGRPTGHPVRLGLILFISAFIVVLSVFEFFYIKAYIGSLANLPLAFVGVYISFRRSEARVAGVLLPHDPGLIPWDKITSYLWMGDGFQLGLGPVGAPPSFKTFFRPLVKTWPCSEEQRPEIEALLIQHTSATKLALSDAA